MEAPEMNSASESVVADASNTVIDEGAVGESEQSPEATLTELSEATDPLQNADAIEASTSVLDVADDLAEPDSAASTEVVGDSAAPALMEEEILLDITAGPDEPEPVVEEMNQDEMAEDAELEISDTLARLTPLLDGWAAAWQSGDFEDYLTAYRNDFDPDDGTTRAEWAAARRPRVDGVQGMTISYDRLELLEQNEDEIIVQFWLQYTRNTYSDDTLKKIIFRQSGDSWLIYSENNLDVIVH